MLISMYLIYGAGKVGTDFIQTCVGKGINNLIITDSNKNLIGTSIEGIVLTSFDEIEFDKVELIIIATSRQYQEEIRSIIRSKTEIEITTVDEVILIEKEDKMYLGGIKLNRDIYIGLYSNNSFAALFDENSFNDLEKFLYLKKHRLINKHVHYTEEYNRFFSRFRGKAVKVLEIGVYKGGSLQMWKDYFGEQAEIIGIDIDLECKKLEEERIHIYIGDQEDCNFLQELKDKIGKIDIIIDDGGHMMQQQIISFQELFAALNDDGVYLCEDIHTSYWNEFDGGYNKKGTFMEYAKWLTDELNEQYFDSAEIPFPYRGQIKSITFCDSMIFIEKKKYANKSLSLFK